MGNPERRGHRIKTTLVAVNLAISAVAGIEIGRRSQSAPIECPAPRSLVQPDLIDQLEVKDELERKVGVSIYSHYWNRLRETALKYGFTLVDHKPYVDALEEADSIDKIVSVVNNFFLNYGITIKIPNSLAEADNREEIKLIDKTLVDPDQTKKGMEHLMLYFGKLPVELIKIAEVKTLRLFQELGELENPIVEHGEIEGIAYRHTPVIDVSLNSIYRNAFAVVSHELGHHFDFRLTKPNCDNDRSFTTNNPSDFRYGIRRDDLAGIGYLDPYAQTDEVEDKATFYGDILGGFSKGKSYIRSVYFENSKGKYANLLSRLDEVLPGIADYLIEISRPIKFKKRPQAPLGTKDAS